MTTIDDLEAELRNCIAINIHRHGAEYRVHVRHNGSEGFRVAQQGHPTVESALSEHFGDADLLV